MSDWNSNELKSIRDSDDLHISPFRDDGKTYGTPTWIWSVVQDNCLYVRPYNGVNSRWYQATLRNKTGRITTAGMTIDVRFEPVADHLTDAVDAAYSAKYKSSPYLKPMISKGVRENTVKIIPV